MNIHLFYSGSIERGNGKPGYSLFPGFSRALPDSIQHPPQRISEWRFEAREFERKHRLPCKIVMHANEQLAKDAARKDMTPA